MCNKEQGYYQSQKEVPPPEYCVANKDGECYHKGCPQLKKSETDFSSCPIPDLERE